MAVGINGVKIPEMAISVQTGDKAAHGVGENFFFMDREELYNYYDKKTKEFAYRAKRRERMEGADDEES